MCPSARGVFSGPCLLAVFLVNASDVFIVRVLVFMCCSMFVKILCDRSDFLWFLYVSSFTAVSFVLIIFFFSRNMFMRRFLSPSYCCVYMHFPGIDFYSRIIVTANSQQPPLDLEHYYKSLSTFLRLANHTRGHHSLSKRDM